MKLLATMFRAARRLLSVIGYYRYQIAVIFQTREIIANPYVLDAVTKRLYLESVCLIGEVDNFTQEGITVTCNPISWLHPIELRTINKHILSVKEQSPLQKPLFISLKYLYT